MSGTPDLQEILAKAQEMQGKLGELQRELAARRVEASAGGGMVTAVVSGELRVLEVRMEPIVFEGGDQAMAQDLIAAAVNAALQKAQAMIIDMTTVLPLPVAILHPSRVKGSSDTSAGWSTRLGAMSGFARWKPLGASPSSMRRMSSSEHSNFL